MANYDNKNGNSSIVSYNVDVDSITVDFKKSTYRYSYETAGVFNVETMKELAVNGSGLCAFISKNRPAFEKNNK